MAVTDKFREATNGSRPDPTSLATQKAFGATSITTTGLSGWPTNTGVDFIMYKYTTDSNGNKIKTPGTQTDWVGDVSGSTISNLDLRAGVDGPYDTINTIIEAAPTAAWGDDLVEGILVQHKQNGTHGAITADSIAVSGNVSVTGTLTVGGQGSGGGWEPGSGTITAVTHNGNRSYDLTTSLSNTALITPGMRYRTTRTVAAPTQCTSLNGTTQYYSKSSPAGMTFTDDFTVSAWVKLSAYNSGALQTIISRNNGTSGWIFFINTAGQVVLNGYNAALANNSGVTSYQSIPLNKWVHVSAQLDMSAFSATPTTSYIMIDGVDVPSSVARAGTNPTSIVQAGNLEVGSYNSGTSPFNGKVAQTAVFNAKVTQATMRQYMTRGMLGSETSLISAYSFNNSINDLNTTNANNLTASGSAVATNADAPFGGQGDGTISSTLDYGIVQKITASTITVQMAEGCTIPATGGVSAFSYSNQRTPYNFPSQKGKWLISMQFSSTVAAGLSNGAWHYTQFGTPQLLVPTGSWDLYQHPYLRIAENASTFIGVQSAISAVASGSPTFQQETLVGNQSEYGSSAGHSLEMIARSGTTRVDPQTATPYYLGLAINGNGTLTSISGYLGMSYFIAENAYL